MESQHMMGITEHHSLLNDLGTTASVREPPVYAKTPDCSFDSPGRTEARQLERVI